MKISTEPLNENKAPISNDGMLKGRSLLSSKETPLGDVARNQVSLRNSRSPFSNLRAMKASWELISFIIFVLIPSIGAVFYFALIAAPQFVAETRFVIRSADLSSPAADRPDNLSNSQGASVAYSPTSQNAYIIAHYIRSRAAVEDLLKKIDLREIYAGQDADSLARLGRNASIEELTDYWLNMIRAYVDSPSGIVTVEVRAFKASDALKIAQALVVLSENLVNEISRKARQDVLRTAEEEVLNTNATLRSTLVELQRTRDSEGMLDPRWAAEETGKLLFQLMAHRARLESDVYVASRSLGRDTPNVRQLTARLEITNQQIESLKAAVAGDSTSATNIASSLRKFEELEIKRLLAEKLLSMAEDGLERARIRAERQNLYFMVFMAPSLPVEALLPKRVAYSFIVPLGFLVAWGILMLLWKTIEDHRT